MKNFLYHYIFKKLFRKDFVMEMGEAEQLGTYVQMNNPAVLKLLKYTYTNILASLAINRGVSEEDKNLIKGRLFQVSMMIDSIENSEENLLRIKALMERKARVSKVLDDIKNKLAFRRN